VSDESHVEAIELEHKPGSVDQKSEALGKFPFAAFEFDDPNATSTPGIRILSPWVFSFSGSVPATRNIFTSNMLSGGGDLSADRTHSVTMVWSASVAYAVGNIVMVSGALYFCISAHTNQTPPNVTYWNKFNSYQ